MKRFITRVSVLLLASLLVSCGGGGEDSPSGGSTTVATGGGTTGGDTSSGTGGTGPATGGGGTPPPPTGGGSTPPPPTGGGSTPPPPTGGLPPPTGPIPSAGAYVEETDPSVVFSASGWSRSSSLQPWASGTVRRSTTPGAKVSFTFNGTSVRWIGSLDRSGGIAKVSIDGGATKDVDTFSRAREIRTPIFTVYDLPPGQHVLTIEVTGLQNPDAASNMIVVDAFEVEPPIVSRLQETDPDMTFSGTWAETNRTSPWSGCCFTRTGGGARFSETADSTATLKFNGTGIRVISHRGPNAGIARIQVNNDQPVEVDLYSATPLYQELVFTASGLTDGADVPPRHTLTITATGRKNAAASAAQVVVDAFEVITPGKRYQEDYQSQDPQRPQILYTGTWDAHHPENRNRPWSEGASSVTGSRGARVDVTFVGTSVSWISCLKANQGSARVLIDGVDKGLVVLRKALPIEGYQHTAYRIDGLPPGQHVLSIVADATLVVVDAFDVRP